MFRGPWWIKFEQGNDREFIALKSTPFASPHTVERFMGRPSVKVIGQAPFSKSGLYTFPECRLIYELDDSGLGQFLGDGLRYTAVVVPAEGGDRWVYRGTGTYFLKLTKDGKQTASIPLTDLVKDYKYEFRRHIVENQWSLGRYFIEPNGTLLIATPPRGKLFGLIPIHYEERYRISCETGRMEYSVVSDKDSRLSYMGMGLISLAIIFLAVRKAWAARRISA